MRLGFLINGLVELLGGVVIYLFPYLLFNEPYSYSLKMYGLLAACFGIISLLCWQEYKYDPLFRRIFLVILFFHGALAMICNGFPKEMMPVQFEATALHGLVFFLLFILYMNDQKPQKQNGQENDLK